MLYPFQETFANKFNIVGYSTKGDLKNKKMSLAVFFISIKCFRRALKFVATNSSYDILKKILLIPIPDKYIFLSSNEKNYFSTLYY